MPKPSELARRAGEVWRLSWVPVPPGGQAGEQLGRGTGSSLEFQDRRVYHAGDDIRHIDWRALARTGEVSVKVYREELLPRLDLLVDTSASMGVSEDKGQLAVDLAHLFAMVARRQGFSVRVIAVGDRPQRLDPELLMREGLEFEGRRSLTETLSGARAHLRSGTLRILISDFLSNYDAALLVRSLAQRAGGLLLLQVLSHGDNHPQVGEALRLEDAESGELRDIVLDSETVSDYHARLFRMNEALHIESRRASARLVSLEAGPGLDELCRELLAPAGLILPG